MNSVQFVFLVWLFCWLACIIGGWSDLIRKENYQAKYYTDWLLVSLLWPLLMVVVILLGISWLLAQLYKKGTT